MTSKYPVCTEDQESHDSENSHSGTFVERGVWLCIDCAMRERDVLLEALQESYDFDDNDLQQAARQIISR